MGKIKPILQVPTKIRKKCLMQSLAHNKWSVKSTLVGSVIAILATIIVITIANMSKNSL